MSKCRRDGNKLDLCYSMKSEIDMKSPFGKRVYLGNEYIFLSGVKIIDFCPFCGGKLTEDQ